MEQQINVEIGKFTLESLTTGMYSEPESCYREYIQNAVDAIDEAIKKGIITIEESRIEIIVDSNHNEISIRDNGIGINKTQASKTLLDIGNSAKRHTTNRGFRGIGRLGGLSYCKKLSFCTTAIGDNEKTIVTFDCEKLKKLLVPGENSEYNLQSVIQEVTTVQFLPEQNSAHYFIVKMEGVDDIATLLDLDIVKDYITQVAPLPFLNRFFWSTQIKSEFEKYGFNIAEYPIFLGTSFENLSQLYKPYKLTIEANPRSGMSKDEINSLSFFNINDENKNPLAYGWYANTSFLGTLIDERVSGIRVRQGNILIGNSKTLSPYFKETRFNNWALGELYIISTDLIPNARRDDFEKNAAFSSLEKGIRNTIGSEISEKIRHASKSRNNPIQKVISKAESVIKKAESVLVDGFNSSYEKNQIATTLETVRKDLNAIPKNSPAEITEQKNAVIKQLTALEEQVEKSSNYKAKQSITSDFSKAEKKIVQAMMEVLTRNFERETVDSLYKEFLRELRSGGRK